VPAEPGEQRRGGTEAHVQEQVHLQQCGHNSSPGGARHKSKATGITARII
jgi:hypothetical protein